MKYEQEREAQYKYLRKMIRTGTVVEDRNREDIINQLSEMSCGLDDIRYMWDGDEESVRLESVLGTDEAHEFKMLCCDLSCECERMAELLGSDIVADCFDDFFMRAAKGNAVMSVYGDFADADYLILAGYDEEYAAECAEKRISRLTKAELLNAAAQCFGIAVGRMELRYKYRQYETVMDILQGRGAAINAVIADINKAYDEADAAEWHYMKPAVKKFDRIIGAVPPEMWVE